MEKQEQYEAAVLDFLNKEIEAVQPIQEGKEQSRELDALVTDLLKQVISESDQPHAVKDAVSENKIDVSLHDSPPETVTSFLVPGDVLPHPEQQISQFEDREDLFAEFMPRLSEAPPVKDKNEPAHRGGGRHPPRDEVLMPIQCEFFAMEGLTQMIGTIGQIMQQAGHTLQFGGIVLTMYDPTLELTHEVDREVRDFFGEIVFQTAIPRDILVAESPSHGLSVIEYAPRARGARAYIELCMEVLERD